ncbi:uncharacterized protein [Penaeus vannamei]|uniref:uncharacterized protein n=1 Tax=Penaeus vannamei TaxID=6689 RepID=UPI00387F8E0F
MPLPRDFLEVICSRHQESTLFSLLCFVFLSLWLKWSNIKLGVAEGLAGAWKPRGQSASEESDVHRYVIEHGMWTPDPGELLGPYEEEAPRRITKAKFLTANNTVTTVQAGTAGAFRCQILDVADHETVSWVRRRDHHLITLGSHTYTNDDRFHVSHTPPFKVVSRRGKEWTLHIKYVQTRDSGVYECQLSTHPPMGILTTLMVIEPVSHITGGPDLYAQEGSDVTLLCRLKNYTVPPTYVFWYHGSEMINYDANRRCLVARASVTREKNGEQEPPAFRRRAVKDPGFL